MLKANLRPNLDLLPDILNFEAVKEAMTEGGYTDKEISKAKEIVNRMSRTQEVIDH